MVVELFDVYGRIDSRREPDNRFSEVYIVHDIFHFEIYSMEQSSS